VYDITGAGDTVLAFLAVGFAHGLSIDDSLKIANRAAGVSVSHHKTYAVSFDELLGEKSKECIFTDWEKLREELDWLKTDQKKKIVFTNGCFDLLHSGHIYLLKEAKKRGDILVVALNSDDSIARFKGEGRPIKTFSERARIMSALGPVDYVVRFEQNTPQELIEYIRPDVLVKGGDYKLENIAGYEAVISYGGKVEVVDYQHGLSTTNLVKSVKRSSSTG
jgi:D-beta-D-heptose 7-phosphate kinase/D-beta-D-heptose 1-phosphate adenosyltransferase